MKRTLSALTLDRLRSLSEDPASPKGLREFHRHQYEQALAESKRQERVVTESPFSRFMDKLETTEK